MNAKRWMIMFFCALLCAFALWALLNVLVDPFNAFGDPVMGWDAYTQTRNPRNSKLVCVSERFGEFDSYIIGSSNAASFRPETLDPLTGCRFYNMFHYGTDTDYDRRLVKYLLENDPDVKNILLVLGMNDANSVRKNNGTLSDREHYALTGESAVSYYLRFAFASPSYAFEKLKSRAADTELPQSFDVFLPESGCYDKRVRDVEPIGTEADYLALHRDDFKTASAPSDLKLVDECLADVAEMRRMCDEAGVTFKVAVVPVYKGQLDLFTRASVDRYFAGLADAADCYNYAVSPISFDSRYFYDLTHTRNDTADMVINALYGGQGYAPENFGYHAADGDSMPSVDAMLEAAEAGRDGNATLPVLLYHHLSDTEEESSTTVSSATFRRHMELLRAEGYVPVTLDEVVAYVEDGAKLPEKPALITFDDGYQSNYELAFPILKEYGFRATIFAIGSSFGRSQYKETDLPIIPHFGADEAKEMAASGLISIESHTFDMHQWAPYEESDTPRVNALPLENESDDDYIAAMVADAQKQAELFASAGLDAPAALAFPSGKHETVCDAALSSCGYRLTFTTDGTRINELARGLSQTMIDLGRMNVAGSTTDEQIIAYLSRTGG